MDLETGFYYYNGSSFINFLEKHTDLNSAEISSIFSRWTVNKKAVVFKVPSSVSGKIWLEVSTDSNTYKSTKPFYAQATVKTYGLVKIFDLLYYAKCVLNPDLCSEADLNLAETEIIEILKVCHCKWGESFTWGVQSIKKQDGDIVNTKKGFWCIFHDGQVPSDFSPYIVECNYPDEDKGIFETEFCSEGLNMSFITLTYDVPPVIKAHESADDLVDYIAENPELGINVYDSEYNHMFFAAGA